MYVLEAAEYRAAAAASTNFGPLIVELWRKVEKRKFEKSFLLFLEDEATTQPHKKTFGGGL